MLIKVDIKANTSEMFFFSFQKMSEEKVYSLAKKTGKVQTRKTKIL